MGFLKDFKAFLMKGDIVNLATAVIIGGAFGNIVKSFTNDILMPPIGMLLNGVDFKDLKLVLKDAVPESIVDGVTVPAAEAVTINYGNFIQITLDFIIIGFCIFLVLKMYERTQKKEDAATPPPAPSNEEKLLTEIRDLLKSKA
ncbi:large-conductance mechanosensitive channel protein MscL [Robertkochia solimangrovi]|uniref:large-conductance mechanosensitive channel protein MscL n=1 Tax=Robertkochia solimangrovi TaxID=2213046 RepID=UPI00117C1F94|nr:large-conductance mechanosensitive channel protein MscL [Robertkochia solimangrovi]TRZ42250.1 large conductance mechanosensitive channel protein MscL [Robertkochia solimangrovi]